MKKYCFDLDGVICRTEKNFYSKSIPIKSNIKKINKLYNSGNYIFIYTSRFMGRSKGNPKLAHKMGYEFTYKQLKKWSLSFHKLIMGKPSYDVIVDDKSINYKKNWRDQIK